MNSKSLVAAALGLTLAAAPLGAASARTRTGHTISLDDDKGSLTAAKVVNKGQIKGNITVNQAGRQSPGKPKYEDFALVVGFDPSPAFADWVVSADKGSPKLKSGVIVSVDGLARSTSRRNFHDALITEIGFPACDVNGGDATGISLTVTPGVTELGKPGPLPRNGKVPGTGKLWLPSNFRLEIQGLEGMRVNKIDAFTIKQAILTPVTGAAPAQAEIEPTKLEFPNLTISVPDGDAGELVDWANDWIVNGENDPSLAREGTLTYLDTDGTALATLALHGIGVEEFATSQITDPCPPHVLCVSETVATLELVGHEIKYGK